MSDGDVPQTKLGEVYSYEELIKDGRSEFEFPMVDERSAYSACYTSGTTGNPKGVYYSHRAIVLHSLVEAISLGLKPDDVYLQLVPMFHANGWGLFFAATLVGCKLVFPGRYTVDNFAPCYRTYGERKRNNNGRCPRYIYTHAKLSTKIRTKTKIQY